MFKNLLIFFIFIRNIFIFFDEVHNFFSRPENYGVYEIKSRRIEYNYNLFLTLINYRISVIFYLEYKLETFYLLFNYFQHNVLVVALFLFVIQTKLSTNYTLVL